MTTDDNWWQLNLVLLVLLKEVRNSSNLWWGVVSTHWNRPVEHEHSSSTGNPLPLKNQIPPNRNPPWVLQMIGKCNHLTSVQTLLLFHHTARLSGFPIVNCGFYMILLYSRKLFDSIISQLVINQPSFINIINDTSPMYWIGPPGRSPWNGLQNCPRPPEKKIAAVPGKKRPGKG